MKNRFSLIGNVSTLVFTSWVKKKADRLLDLQDIFCVVDYRLFNYFILVFFSSLSKAMFGGRDSRTFSAA